MRIALVHVHVHVHVQFETIHPFLYGNGRMGRLLIAALIEQWGLLPEPLMYVSGFLKQHQAERSIVAQLPAIHRVRAVPSGQIQIK